MLNPSPPPAKSNSNINSAMASNNRFNSLATEDGAAPDAAAQNNTQPPSDSESDRSTSVPLALKRDYEASPTKPQQGREKMRKEAPVLTPPQVEVFPDVFATGVSSNLNARKANILFGALSDHDQAQNKAPSALYGKQSPQTGSRELD